MRSDHPLNKAGICIYCHRDRDISVELQELFAFKNYQYQLFKLVFELMVGDKLCNFIALYRSPSKSQDQFNPFKENLELNLELAVQNNPFLVVVLGDFNATPSNWCKSDITMMENKAIPNVMQCIAIAMFDWEVFFVSTNVNERCLFLTKLFYST